MGPLSKGPTELDPGTPTASPSDEELAFDRALAPIVAELSPDGERSSVVQAFARAVLRRVPPAQLENADPLDTAAALVDAFDFVDRRPPGEIWVRLIDADVALDGWRPTGTILEISCEDRPFIVTTVKEELHQLGQRVARMLHPVFGSERDGQGRLAAVLPARTATHRESFLQAELGGRFATPARRALVEAVRGVLGDVFAATDDFDAMRDQVAQLATRTREHAAARFSADEVGEAADLLDWLLDDNFVLLGSCRFPAPDGGNTGDDTSDASHAADASPASHAADASHAGHPSEGLGVLARPEAALRRAAPTGDQAGQLLRISRTAEVSTVHRQVPMHRVDVVEVGAGGEVTGIFRVVGVFSYKANAEPATVTPILRFKLRRILELEDVVAGSHDEAMLVSLFQVLPKDELFDSDVSTLRQTLVGLLAAEDQHDVRVLLRVEPDTSTVAALVSVPQEAYTPTLRHRLERFLLAQLDGSWVDAQVALGDRADAVVRLVVHVEGPLPDEPLDSLERELRLLCRTWDEELAAALTARVGETRGERLALTWSEWFPLPYRDLVRAERAVDDVLELNRLARSATAPADEVGAVRIALTPDAKGNAHARLKVFIAGGAMDLSGFLPIVESLGLWAVEEQNYVLGPDRHPVHLHDFGVTDPSGRPLLVERDGPRLAEAALALWNGWAEVDSLNRLVLRAGLSWQDVAVLRAYRRYRTQLGTTFTTTYVDDVLVENAAISATLVELFAAYFDPVLGAEPQRIGELRRSVLEGCDAVPRLDHDRILRGFLALVDATVRTNRFLAEGTHVALKIDASAVPDVPRPVPYREIFVHGPSMEGIHLRWGAVARGGIRWSDRPDDYRTEVLGLMRAQVLKNAVIVPTGAKGGFIVKRARYGKQMPVDVAQAYEIFVASLLEVTDNVTEGSVVPVPKRRDGDDPYLVVAADRGTASFSDLANRISDEHHFWLGDAFASGGSHGYDHKKLGITARGAWVAVRHHFAELDIDLDAESISVAGIGDMSGDVFGNAMLRSDRIRLVAAFDHRDIFLDPDPDPKIAYQERARLFAKPFSSWQDYDRSLISPGGGVWSRLDKEIELSGEARGLLRVDAASLTSAELIRAILEAPVDLLFAGGIGTFVRASTEPDHDIGDRANAEVRVAGSSIRARVVGEGANLAFTQRARIEYARRGGHINTDAIDNAAGVDTSDREVNIKILLRLATDRGELSVEERDRLLTEVCDDVVTAVLRDCALQSMALSRDQVSSATNMEAAEALMVELEATSVLDRAVEALPTTAEMRSRAQVRAGLTRPELAVLLAGAKRRLAAQLLASHVPDQPALRDALVSYFPPALAVRFDHLLDHHRLRRELISSVMANKVVNRMGATFITRISADTGASAPSVAAAYWIARSVTESPQLWHEIDDHPERYQGSAFVEPAAVISGVLEALTRDYLRRGETDDIAAIVERDRPAFAALEMAMPEIGTRQRRRQRALRAEALVDRGADPAVALQWASLAELEIGPDVAELARETQRPVTGVAEAFLQMAESLAIDRLVERLRQTAVDDRWSRAEWRGLVDDLDDLRREGARRALQDHPDLDAAKAVERFLSARADRVTAVNALVRDVESDRQARLDALGVATRAVRRAID